jgi:hypothetical protein
MIFSMQLRVIFPIFVFLSQSLLAEEKNDFPFYEEYLKESDFRGFIDDAKVFLSKNPDSPKAPRLAHDFMMVGKAINDIETVKQATSMLLFDYTKSLPSLNYISSFDKGSPRLTELLKRKAQEGDLSSKKFAVAFSRAILLIARAQGPELLKDESLRLRTFLLSQKAEIEEITSTSLKLLSGLEKKNSNFSKTVEVVLNKESALGKIKQLATISGQDAKFCQNFYLAQLSKEQASSEEMILFRIKQAIFSQNPQPKVALKLFDSLPNARRQDPNIQFLLATSLHFNDDTKTAISVLKKITSSTEGTGQAWKDISESYSDGLQFLENRKTVLEDSIGKAFQNYSQEIEAFFIKAIFNSESGEDYVAYIGFSKITPFLEIQLYKGKEIQMAYRTSKGKSSILAPNSKEVISFMSTGAIPVPRLGISREIETGSFSYNFNLNFGSSFEEFVSKSSEIMDNSYVSTARGRSVLLSHILNSKVIWLGVASNVNGGTSLPIFSYSQTEENTSQSSLTFDLKGNLKSAQIGNFSLPNLSFGKSKVLEELPTWPDFPVIKKEKFDFPLFMQILGSASRLLK